MHHLRLFACCSCALLLAEVAAAQNQTLFSEDFETGASGWVFDNYFSGLWHLAGPGACGLAVTTMAAYGDAASCTYVAPLVGSAGDLISPPIALLGQLPFTLTFDSLRQMDAFGDSTSVSIRLAGLPGWTPIGSLVNATVAPQQVALTIPGSFAGAVVELGFHAAADPQGNTGFGWAIDNVVVQNGGAPAAPTIFAVTPDHGPTAGRTSVTISGGGFTGATAVQFGGVAALGFVVDGAGQITATSPPAAPGLVAVSVTTPNGTATATAAFDFFVAPAPFGVGCVPQTLLWNASTLPIPGRSLALQTFGFPIAAQFMVLGLANSVWNGHSLPLALGAVGLPGCSLLVAADATTFLGSSQTFAIAVPADPGLLGLHVFAQSLTFGAFGNGTTNALDILIGP